MAKKRIISQQVAERAGVSRTTVSLVLNDVKTANISEETRQPAVRTAFILGLRHALFPRTYAFVAGYFVFLSVIVPTLWALITPALLAFLYNRAVVDLVQIEQGKEPELEIGPFNAGPSGSAPLGGESTRGPE